MSRWAVNPTVNTLIFHIRVPGLESQLQLFAPLQTLEASRDGSVIGAPPPTQESQSADMALGFSSGHCRHRGVNESSFSLSLKQIKKDFFKCVLVELDKSRRQPSTEIFVNKVFSSLFPHPPIFVDYVSLLFIIVFVVRCSILIIILLQGIHTEIPRALRVVSQAVSVRAVVMDRIRTQSICIKPVSLMLCFYVHPLFPVLATVINSAFLSFYPSNSVLYMNLHYVTLILPDSPPGSFLLLSTT